MIKLRFVLIWLTVFYNCLFFVLNAPLGNPVTPKIFIDDFIPLIPVFIVPYLSYEPLPYLSLLYFAFQKKPIFNTALLATWIVLTVSFLTFYFFPTSITRPDVPGSDIFSAAVRWLYSIDNHYAALPSLHAGLTTVSIWGWAQTNSKLRLFMIFWGVMIILSTVLVKQHYIADMISGCLLAVFALWIARGKSDTIIL